MNTLYKFDSYIYNIYVILSGIADRKQGRVASEYFFVCMCTHAYTHIPIGGEGYGEKTSRGDIKIVMIIDNICLAFIKCQALLNVLPIYYVILTTVLLSPLEG